MPTIQLETIIDAPIELCFDLSTSIDLHKLSTGKTNEQAIAGRTSGLIQLNETVTWQATHFGIRQKLTSKITAYERPFHFRDEMLKGTFKSICHDHYFEYRNEPIFDLHNFRRTSSFAYAELTAFAYVCVVGRWLLGVCR